MADRSCTPAVSRPAADVLTFPTARKRAHRSGRLDHRALPENVQLHPTWAARLQRSEELPPPVYGTTATGAIVLGLFALLDRRGRETGAPPMMLDLLREAERFAAPEIEGSATSLVGRLWDQLALEAAARSSRKPKGTRDAPR